MVIAELVDKLLESTRSLPEVYRIELEGKVRDPERGFVSYPTDQVLAVREEVHAVRRTLLVPIRDEHGELQAVARASLILVMPRKPWGIWMLLLAADRAWTVQMAEYAIDATLGPADAFNTGSGLLVPGRVYRFGPHFEDAMLGHMWAPQNKTLGVLAHAADRATLMRYRRSLDGLAPRYRDLLHIGLYEDPHGVQRAQYLSREFFSMTGEPIEMQLPTVNGVRGVLPKGFPADALPKGFSLMLSKGDALAPKKLEAWLDTLAQARLDPRWARHAASDDFDGVQEVHWRASVSYDAAVVLFQRLEESEKACDELAGRVGESLAAVEAAERLRAADAAQLAHVREQLAAAQASERALRALTQTQGGELEQLRGLDAVRLEQQRDAAAAARDALKKELAQTREALQVLREHASQGDFRLSELTPDKWAEIFPLAQIFQHVEVPDWAVQPVYGALDQGQESDKWLARAWAVLRKLEEYAAVKAAGARGTAYMNFKAYVAEYPAQQVTERHVRLTESKTVAANPGMRRARTFSTPQGPQFFEAHVDIGSGQPPAPRLHYYDDTDGPGGKVYVGYIGPHLKNTQTN